MRKYSIFFGLFELCHHTNVQSYHTKRGEIKEIIIKNTSLAYYNYDTFYSGYGKNSKKK